ncbi:MAG TPA: porin [Tenuifilaceae bacterium]|nr:porin [Tenuifilaceae bacterium]HPE18419.1 porin [Tenuifilaceae bacterium]HPJ46228.1 porin [Tenuifilaceae bacterium]HPQ33850.1 porin [Tenuifilaceae bacterium]HRX67708.1 porin [Tenuifilaceae bacterium]
MFQKNLYRAILFGLVFTVAWQNAAFSQGCVEVSSDDDGVKLFGYIQPQWEYWQNADNTYGNSFAFDRARLGVTGTIPYDVSYYAMIDFSRFKNGSSFILDAFVSYTRFEWAKMSIGQFKSPLSLEQNTPCQSLHTVYRSKVVDELGGPQRDMGFMLFGGTKESKIRYSIALMNDYKQGFKDENNGKSVKSRVVFAPVEFIQVGGSFGYGVTGINSDNKKTRAGADLQVSYGNFLLQGEYLWGDDTGDYTTGGGCDGSPLVTHTGGVTRSGFFAHAMYMTPWNLQPVFKFESYDSDMSIDSNSETIMTFGLNYFMNDWTRIQVNYRYKAEQAFEIPNDQVVIQVQAKF